MNEPKWSRLHSPPSLLKHKLDVKGAILFSFLHDIGAEEEQRWGPYCWRATRGRWRFSSITEMATCSSRAPRITRPPCGMPATASAWARTAATTERCGVAMFPVSLQPRFSVFVRVWIWRHVRAKFRVWEEHCWCGTGFSWAAGGLFWQRLLYGVVVFRGFDAVGDELSWPVCEAVGLRDGCATAFVQLWCARESC
jgi:hypothetical protein